jgi:hypothetical protein
MGAAAGNRYPEANMKSINLWVRMRKLKPIQAWAFFFWPAD